MDGEVLPAGTLRSEYRLLVPTEKGLTRLLPFHGGTSYRV